MSESISDELRKMLKGAEYAPRSTPVRGTPHRNNRHEESGVPLDELASLISSIQTDAGGTPLNVKRNRVQLGSSIVSSSGTAGGGGVGGGFSAALHNKPPQPPFTPQRENDQVRGLRL